MSDILYRGRAGGASIQLERVPLRQPKSAIEFPAAYSQEAHSLLRYFTVAFEYSVAFRWSSVVRGMPIGGRPVPHPLADLDPVYQPVFFEPVKEDNTHVELTVYRALVRGQVIEDVSDVVFLGVITHSENYVERVLTCEGGKPLLTMTLVRYGPVGVNRLFTNPAYPAARPMQLRLGDIAVELGTALPHRAMPSVPFYGASSDHCVACHLVKVRYDAFGAVDERRRQGRSTTNDISSAYEDAFGRSKDDDNDSNADVVAAVFGAPSPAGSLDFDASP